MKENSEKIEREWVEEKEKEMMRVMLEYKKM